MSSNEFDRRGALAAATLVAAATFAGKATAQASGGRMTVHVLDLFTGVPANGVKVELFSRKGGDTLALVKSVVTGPGGRPDAPLLAAETFVKGRYLIAFDLTDYFKSMDKSLPAGFFRKISMEFEVVDASIPHHIPLQCTPWTQACSVLPG